MMANGALPAVTDPLSDPYPGVGRLQRDEVADCRPAPLDRADGEFQDAVRAPYQRDHPGPGAQPAMDRHNGTRPLAPRIGLPEEDRVDRETHEHHVDAVRTRQPQPRAGLEPTPAHQA